jgi:hypothetical protein
MTKTEDQSKPMATMTIATPQSIAPSSSSAIIVKSSAAVSTPIALPTRMVLSACAGMGAATFCHPLGMFSTDVCVCRYFY